MVGAMQHRHVRVCVFKLRRVLHDFLDGYCSTVQGLLDWFKIDVEFAKLLFIQTDLCVLCVEVAEVASRVAMRVAVCCSVLRHDTDSPGTCETLRTITSTRTQTRSHVMMPVVVLKILNPIASPSRPSYLFTGIVYYKNCQGEMTAKPAN